MKKSFFGLIVLFIFLTTYTPKFDFIIGSDFSIQKIEIEGNSILNSDDVFDFASGNLDFNRREYNGKGGVPMKVAQTKMENLKKYSKGQTIEVKLIDIQDEKAKVSKRKLDKDPWDYFKQNNKKTGDIITTRVIEALKTGSIKVAADPARVIGLNTVGMTRNNISSDSISLIKKAFKLLYMKKLKIEQAINKIKDLNKSRNDPCLDIFIKSVEISERGILR